MDICIHLAGGVKVIIDVGFERDEVNTNIPNVDLANNQQHVVNVKRSNKGRTLTVQVCRPGSRRPLFSPSVWFTLLLWSLSLDVCEHLRRILRVLYIWCNWLSSGCWGGLSI